MANSFVSKIFNWKVFSVVYIFLFILLSIFLNNLEQMYYMTSVEMILSHLLSFANCFGFALCLAVGWKKQFCTNKTAIFLAFAFIISFFGVALYNLFMYPDAFSLLGFLIYLILTFIPLLPMVIAFVVYLINSNNYESVQKPVFKFLYLVIALSTIQTLVRLIIKNIQDFHFYNVFDYISIFCGIFALIIGVCYAWNIKIKNRKLAKQAAVYLILSNLLPINLLSSQYLTDVGMNLVISNYAGIVYTVLLLLFEIFVIYRYAFSKDVYNED